MKMAALPANEESWEAGKGDSGASDGWAEGNVERKFEFSDGRASVVLVAVQVCGRSVGFRAEKQGSF